MEEEAMTEETMTVAAFVDCYYRPERLAREPGTRDRIISDREHDIRTLGSAMISRHDSVTGAAVTLYDPRFRPAAYLRWAATYREA